MLVSDGSWDTRIATPRTMTLTHQFREDGSIAYDEDGESILLDTQGRIGDKAELGEITGHNEVVPTLFMKQDKRKKFEYYLAQCQKAYFEDLRFNRDRVNFFFFCKGVISGGQLSAQIL